MQILQPNTLNEAKMLLANGNLKILAGGTDLIINIRKNNISTELLLDISKIRELFKIKEEREYILVGPMTTFSEIKENQLIKKYFNCLYECSKHMGSPQIRNMATLGGNIINAASAADSIPCLMSLDSEIVLESINRIRKIKIEDYFNNYNIEHIKEDEILTNIIIPKNNFISGYYKLGKRNSLAISRISAAVSLSITDLKINKINLFIGAAGRFPFKVNEIENVVLNKDQDALFQEKILNILEDSVYSSISGRRTVNFKKEAVKGIYKQALYNALKIEGV